ncbi:MAG: LPS export ABC transporter ATP-binding protein [Sphingobacteriia bacterium]|nr:LPS export ABC transporter ATP-binding protein [Sphingobacteriia bacterium]
MTVLHAEGLAKFYGDRMVVRDVSLELKRGEIVGLLGPNGAGKTTCFYMIAGLIAPDDGKIYLGDYEITTMAMYRRARLGLGYLPQEASIFRGLTVEENLMAVLEVVEPSTTQRAISLEEILEAFSLRHLRKILSTTLSGGERRRLEIARAIAAKPHFLLLDEPFAGVDPVAVNEIKNLIDYLADIDIGILITDHNVRETLGIVNRAYIVHDGSILMHGTPNEVIQNEDVRRVYLGEKF